MKTVFESHNKENLLILIEDFKNNYYVDRKSIIRKKKKQVRGENYDVYTITIYHRGKRDPDRKVTCLNINPSNGLKCRRMYGHTGKHCIQRDYAEW